MGQGPEMFVHAKDLDLIGAGGAIRQGGDAGQLKDGGGQVIGRGGTNIESELGAEKAVARRDGEMNFPQARQGHIREAATDAVADGEGADEHGRGDNDAQERA